MDHTNVFLPNVPKPCEDCFIIRAEPDLVYEDGTRANLDSGLMLHHAVLFNTRPARHDLREGHVLRPLGRAVPRFGQRAHHQGAARRVRIPPRPRAGHRRVPHHEPLRPRRRPCSSPSRSTGCPGRPQGVRPVTPVWLDVDNCRTSEYQVPAGPTSTHWTWPSTITGRDRGDRGPRPHRRRPHHGLQPDDRSADLHLVGRLRDEARLHGHDRVDELLLVGTRSASCGPATRSTSNRSTTRQVDPRRHGDHGDARMADRRSRVGSPAPAEANGGVAPAAAANKPSDHDHGGHHH